MSTNRPAIKHPIDLDRNNRGEVRVDQDSALPNLSREAIWNIASSLDSQSVVCLSESSSIFYADTKRQRNNKALPLFLKAVVNDDRQTVKLMLEVHPNLLLVTPPHDMVVTTRAWQIFYAEAAPIMAAKRGQIEMLNIMRPYFDYVPDQEKANAMLEAVKQAWVYKTSLDTTGEEKIIIPDEYTDYANSLITAFAEPMAANEQLGEIALYAFLAYFNLLLPKKAIHLNDYVNPELWLLALERAYWSRPYSLHFNMLEYCVHLIGLAQSVLSVESAKIFCAGFLQVVEEKKELSEHARDLKLNDSKTCFYPSERPSVNSATGAGFQFYCEFTNGDKVREEPMMVWRTQAVMEKNYVTQTQQVHKNYATDCRKVNTL